MSQHSNSNQQDDESFSSSSHHQQSSQIIQQESHSAVYEPSQISPSEWHESSASIQEIRRQYHNEQRRRTRQRRQNQIIAANRSPSISISYSYQQIANGEHHYGVFGLDAQQDSSSMMDNDQEDQQNESMMYQQNSHESSSLYVPQDSQQQDEESLEQQSSSGQVQVGSLSSLAENNNNDDSNSSDTSSDDDNDQSDNESSVIIQQQRRHYEILQPRRPQSQLRPVAFRSPTLQMYQIDFDRQSDQNGQDEQDPQQRQPIPLQPRRRPQSSRGLQKSQVSQFPQMKWGKNHVKHNPDEQCSCCLEKYEVGHELRVLSCAHRYHKACIDQWLKRKTVCPLCKTELKK